MLSQFRLIKAHARELGALGEFNNEPPRWCGPANGSPLCNNRPPFAPTGAKLHERGSERVAALVGQDRLALRPNSESRHANDGNLGQLLAYCFSSQPCGRTGERANGWMDRWAGEGGASASQSCSAPTLLAQFAGERFNFASLARAFKGPTNTSGLLARGSTPGA